ncbi:MAG: T9SS type A sorting domain-containing protein [Saprospirales bacterium]|nr:T9SS type A sorting domain-containing protein [Saprospirales bacterium]
MKKHLILLAMSSPWAFHGAIRLFDYTITFDDTLEIKNLFIDTVSNPNNIWQVGIPQKVIFTDAYSAPNVIVTDTANPYPVNDTSVFIISNTSEGGFVYYHTVILAGQYFVNSDTLSDYGMMEFSPDNGITWVDLLNDSIETIFGYWHWDSYLTGLEKPVLTGNSNGWKEFWVHLTELGPVFDIQLGDTVLYRFTFISDSIQTGKDGLMFDDLHFEDWVEGTHEIQNDKLISIAPNPVSDNLAILRPPENGREWVQVFDCNGRLLFDNDDFRGEHIDVCLFRDGLYYLRYANGDFFSVKKFIVAH